MPHQSGLLYRKGRYYLNIRVPKDLRSLFGQTEIIRKALKTSDYHEAVREVRYQAGQMEAHFAERRRAMKAKASKPEREKLNELSTREAHNLVFRFLIGLKKSTEKWWEMHGSTFDKNDRK